MGPTTKKRISAASAAALALPVLLATPAQASSVANEVVYTADSDGDGTYGMSILNLDNRRITPVFPETSDEFYDGPELSPDGTRVAFSTSRGGSPGVEGIAAANRDGTGFQRLTNPVSSDTGYTADSGAAWSPDGKKVLFTRISIDFTSEAETFTTSLWTVPAAGGTETKVPGSDGGYTADWSPDGTKIVYADLPQGGESGAITVINADGTGKRALGPEGLMPAWSPDGTLIAYSVVTTRDPNRDVARDTAQIATVPAGGGVENRLAKTQPTSAASAAQYPSWTPDSRGIVFDLYGYDADGLYGPGDIWGVDRDGRRAGKLHGGGGDEGQPHVQGPAPTDVTSGASSTYEAVTPKRILDTRNGTGAPAGKVGPGGTLELQVSGFQTAEGPVPAGITAVVLNLTVTGTTASTDVRAYPTGGGIPTVSNLNAGANRTVPNLVTVQVGTGGKVTLRNSGGSVHLIADIAGYYSTSTTGDGFAALSPGRILDTRNGTGAAPTKVGPADSIDLQVTGTLPTAGGGSVTVPGDASAVVLNVTATGVTASTDVRVYPRPADGSVPTVSNLNLTAGQTAANLVTVAVGEGGEVRLRNASGSTHLIADIAGYYSAGASGRFVPVSPERFLDTRNGTGAAPVPTGAAGELDLKVGGRRGVPAGATAFVLNVTGTGVTASTDVRAYPSGAGEIPTVSNLNLTKGDTRANLAIVKAGNDGQVRLRNSAGSVHLIGDLAGYMIG